MLIWKFFKAGYPVCHERCARNYWTVLWDLGTEHETFFKLSLN